MMTTKVMAKARPLVPSILNTTSNKPFTLLLPAWILDSLANAIIGSLLTFFVRYVVRPEYSNQEKWGCLPMGGSDRWECDSGQVLGVSVVALLFGALAFTPMWLLISRFAGKRNTWLFWSFTNGATFLCYAVVGAGDVYLCVIMSVFNGAPMGAKFLADAIMADVIDYDEFLTGTRSEATYTMFKGFLPKIAAIPASAVPIVLLGAFGHVPPIDGVLQVQPSSVESFIKIVIIYIPSALAFGAFLIKLRFPLKTQRHNDVISEGIAEHLVGNPAADACSGKPYRPVNYTDDEMETVDIVGNFTGVAIIESLLEDVSTGSRLILRKARIQLALGVMWLLTFASVSFATFPLLLSEKKSEMDLQVIPVLSIVGFGIGITIIAFTTLRLRGANQLQKRTPQRETLEKMKCEREALEELRQFDTSITSSLPCLRGGRSLSALQQADAASSSQSPRGTTELVSMQ